MLSSSRTATIIKLIAAYVIVTLTRGFDRRYYRRTNRDVATAQVDPLLHYLRSGWSEDRDPSATFDTRYYIELHPEILFSAINPLVHYLTLGRADVRQSSSTGDGQRHPSAPWAALTSLPHRSLAWIVRLVFAPFIATPPMPGTPRSTQFFVPKEIVAMKHHVEIVNWNGESPRLVERDSRLWIVKHSRTSGDRGRELLVSSLARHLVNAAEVLPLSSSEIRDLFGLKLVGNVASPENTILVRLAQDYAAAELPLQDPDSATAGELVFSLWVRRRDAYSYNRALTREGVPVFFDFHASLDFEPWLADAREFFAHKDRGHAGRWRVFEDKSVRQDTLSSRATDSLLIRDKGKFISAVDGFVAKIQSTDLDFHECMRRSGIAGSRATRLIRFLQEARSELHRHAALMLEVVFAADGHGS